MAASVVPPIRAAEAKPTGMAAGAAGAGAAGAGAGAGAGVGAGAGAGAAATKPRRKAASLLPGGGTFTRGGKRSTVASNLRVKPGKQPAAFNERQERLYAKIRYQAETKIDEALGRQRDTRGNLQTGRERRRAERAAKADV